MSSGWPSRATGVSGFCAAWIDTFVPAVDPTLGCAAVVPRTLIYDPFVNDRGARCTLQDANVNLFGRGDDSFGRRPLDNAGVEYGRAALETGAITVDQFLDLNEGIGGYDPDGIVTPERMIADPDVIEDAYRHGRVLHGDSAVIEVPVIDVDLYSDLGYDIHDRFRLFSVRDRLEGPDGDPAARTRVIWTRDGGGLTDLVKAPLPTVEMIGMLAEWLEGTVDGTSVAAARPDDVTDSCEANGAPFEGDQLYEEQNDCTEAFPVHGDPRTAAGAPRSNQIIKCTLRPVDVGGYGVPFDDAQAARLTRIFPDGACDWDYPAKVRYPSPGPGCTIRTLSSRTQRDESIRTTRATS